MEPTINTSSKYAGHRKSESMQQEEGAIMTHPGKVKGGASKSMDFDAPPYIIWSNREITGGLRQWRQDEFWRQVPGGLYRGQAR